MRATKYLLLAGVSVGLQMAPRAAEAQAEPDGADRAIEELIVTAQKRAENVQDVPISISAFSGQTLEAAQVTDIKDLVRLAANVQFDNPVHMGKTRLTIRGIGAAGGVALEPSVAMFIDGVYIPREGAAVGAFLDVDGIEVLRGPQGTLFGRNATGGAISLRSALPTQAYAGEITGEYGTGDRFRLEGFANVPVSERVAFRLAFMNETFDGLYKNEFDGNSLGGADQYRVRLSGRFEITPELEAVFRLGASRLRGDGFANTVSLLDTFPPGTLANYIARNVAVGGVSLDPEPFDRTVNLESHGSLEDRTRTATSDITYSPDNGFTFRLISSFQYWKNFQVTIGDTPVFVPTRDILDGWKSHSYSHELQIISPKDQLLGGRLDFVAGLYFFEEDFTMYQWYIIYQGHCIQLATPAQLPSCLAAAARPGSHVTDYGGTQNLVSMAAYGQANFKLTPQLDLVLGARLTDDDKKAHIVQVSPTPIGRAFGGNEDSRLRVKDSKPTYRVGLNWRPADNLMAFASYSTGYKSGAIAQRLQTRAIGALRILDPETIKNYEVGFKSDWFDRRLILNATLYDMKIHDYQDRAVNATTNTQELINAGDIRNKGVEVDATAQLFEGLRVNGSVAYLDSKFTRYPGAPNLPGLTGRRDLTGFRPVFSPKWSGGAGVEYEHSLPYDMRFLARADMSFTSSHSVGVQNNGDPNFIDKAHQLVSARFTIYGPDDRLSASVFGENLFDEGYCTSRSYITNSAQFGVVVPGRTAIKCAGTVNPRTLGVSISARY